MTIMVFDIETVPDYLSGRKLYNFDFNLEDQDVVKAMLAKRRQQNGTEFLPLHLHKIVAISVVVKTEDWVKVWSLGDENDSEEELVKRFFHGVERYSPTLVSWNGSGFDLPVLHYRALLHGVTASRYWDTGEKDKDFKWNNYISRYHARHTDVMDVIAAFQMRANAPLDDIAQMLGFPGKMGLKGDQVLSNFFNNKIKEVRDYCETDVLNTYLVYLRFLLTQGKLSKPQYESECNNLRIYLADSDKEHFQKYLQNWHNN